MKPEPSRWVPWLMLGAYLLAVAGAIFLISGGLK